jgi:transposase
LSYKKTRLIPGNAPDKATQELQIGIILETISQADKNGEAVVFIDPTHQIYNAESGYLWQEKGGAGTKQIFSNSGRRRITIVGAINPHSLSPTTLITEGNCDRELMKLFIRELRKDYPGGEKIHAFLDNARYNWSKDVRAEAKRLNVELKYLPPYCPNLNLIERLWKFMKKAVKKNAYHDTFEKFEKAICEFFKNIGQFRDKLETLLTLNFEII